ncbi:MAG: CsgG/HfaB family protein [Trueperaceae bacterium]
MKKIGMKKSAWVISLVVLLVVAACAPTTSAPASTAAAQVTCYDDTMPTVAIIEFENTGAGYGGAHVLGVEVAATARLINLMVNSGCYRVIEQSELQSLIAAQGLESTDPAELARAAGAGYVITGVVTRSTLSRPSGALAGFGGGVVQADISVDMRATDVITGQIVVSVDASASKRNPNISFTGVPLVGNLSAEDPTYGPLVADAAEAAMVRALQEFTLRF